MPGAVGNIEALYFALLNAWNRRDADAMASLYARSGGQVGFDGSIANGPEEIRQHLTPIFRDHPTARFVGIVRETRVLSETCAILRAVAGMIPPGQTTINPKTNAIQTLVCSQDEQRWCVEMFQNTPAAFDGRPGERDRLTAELQAAADSTSQE